MENKDINININPVNNKEKKEPIYVKVANSILKTISDAKWTKILKIYFVMFFFLATGIVAFYAYNVVKDADFVKTSSQKIVNSQKGEDIRDFIVTPKIQHELEILVYSLNAERAFIFELHNGKKNTSGLPFRFADMTYEVVNEEKKVDKTAMKFQDIPLTLYKYPHYLQKQKIIIGTVDDISLIDEDFAGHIKEIGGKYLGMIYLNSNGTPIGFLCVSYHNTDDIPKPEVIKYKLTEYGKMITHLLDLRVHIENENDDE